MGVIKFWYNGIYFRFICKKEFFINIGGFFVMKDFEEIKIFCYGWLVGKLIYILFI